MASETRPSDPSSCTICAVNWNCQGWGLSRGDMELFKHYSYFNRYTSCERKFVFLKELTVYLNYLYSAHTLFEFIVFKLLAVTKCRSNFYYLYILQKLKVPLQSKMCCSSCSFSSIFELFCAERCMCSLFSCSFAERFSELWV